MEQLKQVEHVLPSPPGHWVGDGFPVRTIFSYDTLGSAVSPFLLLDYAEPYTFTPAHQRRGVGEHPHRGFETVTLVYQGALEHRDSAGNHGIIGPGDVQWMTAASGVVHEEFHEHEFARRGGVFQVVQLWVNLPAKHKMSAPGYQTLVARDIPVVELPSSAGSVRVIAGEFQGQTGPARTFTPVTVWDVRLHQGAQADLTFPRGQTALVFLLGGSLRINDGAELSHAELAMLSHSGDRFSLHARESSVVLVLGGKPIDEPIVGRGPFVMNTQDEIHQAIRDYQNGRMGHLLPVGA